MTVAAIEATVLRECLRRGERGLPRRFFRATARKVRVAWQTAVGSDLSLPEGVGPPLSMRITNAYLQRVMTAAETDPVVTSRFMRVIGTIDARSAVGSVNSAPRRADESPPADRYAASRCIGHSVRVG
jgi:hypothetical protein